MKKTPIIIDCDPGQDDAIAIFLAMAASQRLDTLAITTVAGNVSVDKTSRNARIVCEWAGRPDIPVHAGCERPLMRAPVFAEHVHGSEGLEGPELHEPAMPLQALHAVDALIDTLRTHGERVTICALGPLTNIAMALMKAPDIRRHIAEIVIMGGAMSEGGNITPCAEFNFFVDPHAAKIVLASGLPITMVPLDATHQVLVTPAHLEQLARLGNGAGMRAAQILGCYALAERGRFGGAGGPLHDPCVIAYVLAPQLFTGRMVNVCVETGSALTQGMTAVDWWGVTGRQPNVRFLRGVDAAALLDLLITSFVSLP